MRLPTWLIRKSDSRMVFLRGGTEAEVRLLLNGSGMPSLTTVCDRATAERLSQAAVLAGERPPSVLVSRGFRQDCAALIAAPKPRVTLIHDAVFAVHLQATCSRLANRLQLLGGYDVPGTLVERVAMAGIWQHANEIAQSLATPLLIHISKSTTVPTTAGATAGPGDTVFTVFEFPDHAVPSLPLTPDTTALVRATEREAPVREDGVPATVQPNAIASEAVAAHAKFLTDMDHELLCTLHSPLAIDQDRLIFDFWADTLAAYGRTAGQSAIVSAAQSKLAAVRARVLAAVPIPT